MGYSRRRTEGEGQRATTLELFYDLVFVFAIIQVSHLLLEHLTWAGVGQSLLVLLVVRPTLDALGRRSTVLPGLLSKVLTYSLAPLPRWARVRIMGRVMDGMTKHGRGDSQPGSE